MKNFGPILLVVFVVLAFVLYYGSYINVSKHCEGGHIVKNVWDWPVCVH